MSIILNYKLRQNLFKSAVHFLWRGIYHHSVLLAVVLNNSMTQNTYVCKYRHPELYPYQHWIYDFVYLFICVGICQIHSTRRGALHIHVVVSVSLSKTKTICVFSDSNDVALKWRVPPSLSIKCLGLPKSEFSKVCSVNAYPGRSPVREGWPPLTTLGKTELRVPHVDGCDANRSLQDSASCSQLKQNMV